MRGERKFAVFDIDGTLVRWQLYHAIADALASRGHIEPKSYEVMRESRMAWKRRSGGTFKEYESQVIKTYESVLKTLNPEQVEVAIRDVFDEYKDQVYTYTRDLIAKLNEEGYLLFAISGSQSEIVAQIAEHYGFDDFIGTIYERLEKGFSGRKTIGSRDKDMALKQLVKKHAATYADSIAVGDSLSDVKMLELVEQPIAFNPEKELFEYSRKKGWKIVIERKNVVYKLTDNNGIYQLAEAS